MNNFKRLNPDREYLKGAGPDCRTKYVRRDREPFGAFLGVKMEHVDYHFLEACARDTRVSVSEYVRIWIRGLRADAARRVKIESDNPEVLAIKKRVDARRNSGYRSKL